MPNAHDPSAGAGVVSALSIGHCALSLDYMYMPPLTASTCPVIYAASSDARKHTAAAMSWGVPSRLRGISDAHSPRILSPTALVMSVSTSPGATTLTGTFRG